MRSRLLILAAFCLTLTISGCQSVADDPLCYSRQSHHTILPATDGDSGADDITIEEGHSLMIRYVAVFDSGSGKFEVFDSSYKLVWQKDIAKTAQPQTISINPPLAPGNYKVIQSSKSIVNSTICWQAIVQ